MTGPPTRVRTAACDMSKRTSTVTAKIVQGSASLRSYRDSGGRPALPATPPCWLVGGSHITYRPAPHRCLTVDTDWRPEPGREHGAGLERLQGNHVLHSVSAVRRLGDSRATERLATDVIGRAGRGRDSMRTRHYSPGVDVEPRHSEER